MQAPGTVEQVKTERPGGHGSTGWCSGLAPVMKKGPWTVFWRIAEKPSSCARLDGAPGAGVLPDGDVVRRQSDDRTCP